MSMTHVKSRSSWGLAIVAGGALFVAANIGSGPGIATAAGHGAGGGAGRGAVMSADTAAKLAALVREDPQSFLCQAREHVEEHVEDYRCTFYKRERKGGELSAEEVIHVLYREEPQAVYMTWVENAQRIKRALYIEGAVADRHGRPEAWVEPTGAARLFCAKARIAIHGEKARAAGRYTIDQFGFLSALDMLCSDNERFADKGVLDVRYEGEGQIDGRPTYVIMRDLPYDPKSDVYPDARLVVHVDQEWLVPVSIRSYADAGQRQLIASYVMKNVKMNVGLETDAFSF